MAELLIIKMSWLFVSHNVFSPKILELEMFMKSKIISTVIIAVVAAIVSPSSAFAAEKIATVNIQEVMSKSSAVQSVNKQVDGRRKSFQEQMKKKEEQLRAAEQDLGKQRTSLSTEAFEQKKKAFRDEITDAQRDLQQKKVSLEKGVAGAMGQVQKTVQGIVEDLAKEKSFEIAIATSQLLWAKSEMDITPEVIERLNKTLPDVKVAVESGQ